MNNFNPDPISREHVRFDDQCVILQCDRRHRLIQKVVPVSKSWCDIEVGLTKSFGYIPVVVYNKFQYDERISEDKRRFHKIYGDVPYVIEKGGLPSQSRLEKGVVNTLLILECIGIIMVTLIVVIPLFWLAFAL